jgi:hypothetical protein
MDISVPKRGKTKPIVDAVLLKIRDDLNIQLESLDDYHKDSALQNVEAAEAYIRGSLHPNQNNH